MHYVVTIALPDGCSYRIDESGPDDLPVVDWIAVSDGHEHPDDPDAYAIYESVARAFLGQLYRPRSSVTPDQRDSMDRPEDGG